MPEPKLKGAIIKGCLVTIQDFIKHVDDMVLKTVDSSHPNLKKKKEHAMGALEKLEELLNVKEEKPVQNLSTGTIQPPVTICGDVREKINKEK